MTNFHRCLLTLCFGLLFVPPVASASCNTLIVDLTVKGWKIDSLLSCKHGDGERKNDTQAQLRNIGYYGPDCRLLFVSEEEADVKVLVEFQQNLCVLEAGNITVTVVSSPGLTLEYTAITGAFEGNTAGKVTVTGFKTSSALETEAAQ